MKTLGTHESEWASGASQIIRYPKTQAAQRQGYQLQRDTPTFGLANGHGFSTGSRSDHSWTIASNLPIVGFDRGFPELPTTKEIGLW